MLAFGFRAFKVSYALFIYFLFFSLLVLELAFTFLASCIRPSYFWTSCSLYKCTLTTHEIMNIAL